MERAKNFNSIDNPIKNQKFPGIKAQIPSTKSEINPAPFGQSIKLCPKDFISDGKPTASSEVLKGAG